jgi:hypothetical protein
VVGCTTGSRGYLPGKEPEIRRDGGDEDDDNNTKLGGMGRGM